MKTKLIAGLITMLFLASMLSMRFAAPAAATPDSNIVGLWHFDEGTGSTASDSSGYGNDGTLSGGKFGNALQFDGVDDYVIIPKGTSFDNLAKFTVEFWVKFYDLSEVMQILRYWESGGHRVFSIAWFPTYLLCTYADSDVNPLKSKDFTFQTGVWYHIALTMDSVSDEMKLYIDGVLNNERTNLGSPQASDEDFYLGGDAVRNQRYFDGIIDEVRISDFARTSFDLTQAPSQDTNTVALWHFDESVGGMIYDETTNNNDGTIHGASWAGPTWVDGYSGKALSFDGVDDYVKVPDVDILDLTTFTAEAWIKVSQYPASFYGVVVKGANVPTPTQNYGLFIGSNGKVRLQFSSGGTYTLGETYIDSETNVVDGEWHHIAGTFDGANLRLYIDGNLETTGITTTKTPDINTYPLTIGVRLGLGVSPLYHKGIIDEVRIWNVALPLEAEIDINPDTLNLKSNGQWITAYITLPEGFNVEDIIPEEVYLDGITAVWSEIQNGVYMAKFDRAAVQEMDDCEVGTKFQELTLTVTGKLSYGQLTIDFEGSDTIRVIKK